MVYVFDMTVEALDHTVCPGRSWRRQAVFDIQFGAELVELMFSADLQTQLSRGAWSRYFITLPNSHYVLVIFTNL